jgi:hypothetical protein
VQDGSGGEVAGATRRSAAAGGAACPFGLGVGLVGAEAGDEGRVGVGLGGEGAPLVFGSIEDVS